jgi:hypothetical protein
MDDRLALFAWTLVGAGGFAVLGSLFGAVAGGMAWRHGNATGSIVGGWVVRVITRVTERELSPVQRGAIGGAVDGFVFLGVVGTLFGLAVGFSGRLPGEWIVPALVLTGCLLAAAAFFGLLAYALIESGVQVLVPVCCGGVAGAVLAAHYFGTRHIVPGAVAGFVFGAVAGLIARWFR